VRARRLAAELGVRELWLKDDSANYPTWSYKDRVVSVAITKAVELGFSTVGCASTGNLAHSVAAHAAQAGLEAVVIIPHDLEEGKIVSTQVFGPRMIKVRGNYDEVNVRAGQREPAAVLHRRRQDPRLRDR
jgi:threonine synthase